jgi:WD40 repeat protein
MADPRRSFALHGHPAIVVALAFSRDGRSLASSSLQDRGVRIWDVANGERKAGFDLPAESLLVTSLEYSPDGRTLLLGIDHGKVYFRDCETHDARGILEAHVGWVKSLALTADGKTLVTGGNDGFVRVWDVAKLCGVSGG